ncbi:rapid alkalinization factor [Actinidia eriantha]|uniref:rapid alkalinization factor n=1 Tax=Actinidia eriantha TaxID=165200 RepID=UPI00258F3B07|nr:rapid alkalinization factor [Actinidia eriantha]
MANSRCFLISSLLMIIASMIVSSTAVEASGDHHHQWMWTASKPACDGSIAECAEADEFEMDSEINRRILATTTKFISYDVLKRDTVPCSRRGQSYYNCQPGAEANPYHRGCNAITRCRS